MQYLSILVNGEPVSYLGQSSTSVQMSQGPWSVVVIPGAVNYGASLLDGLQFAYGAGVESEILITLMDAQGNKIGSALPIGPTVAVSFSSGGQTSPATISQTTYNTDGTILAQFIPVKAMSSASISVAVGGSSLSIPTAYNGQITIVAGDPNASGSTCALSTTSINSGVAANCECIIRDSQGNEVSVNGLFVRVYARLYDHSSAYPPFPLSQSGLDPTKYTGQINPLIAGSYDYYAALGQPGGLMASYYVNSDLSQLIVAETGIAKITKYSGDADVQYTRIDPTINFDWPTLPEVDGVSAQSVAWQGLIDLQSSTSFMVVGTGHIMVFFNSVIQIDTTMYSFPTFSISYNMPAGQQEILIRYYPPTINSQLSVQYTTASSNTFVVPPSYLSTKYTVPGFSGSVTPLTVTAGVITQGSLIIPAPIVLGQQTVFYLIFRDANNNVVTNSGCVDVVLSVKDVASTVVPNAFGQSQQTLTALCSGLTNTDSGYMGFFSIFAQVDDFKLSAEVTTTSSTTATIVASDVSILAPSNV